MMIKEKNAIFRPVLPIFQKFSSMLKDVSIYQAPVIHTLSVMPMVEILVGSEWYGGAGYPGNYSSDDDNLYGEF